ncbi:PUL domain-containing protein [Xylaria venustula]|nr:PUL domain-containing protein [Xylaria venustula]
MDVHLLVYDLSGGLARQFSMGMLGFQLDAVYHTSIELEGTEYVYDSGINTIRPGSSHLGRPLERIHLGKTELPLEVIVEYVDSLREIYTPQAYDLFRHNCNNFSNDFSTFLLGKGIPDHIANMPQAVLDSPFGRMLQPQLAQMVEQRKAAQGGLLGIQNNQHQTTATAASSSTAVVEVSSRQALITALEGAANKAAMIFFTSATCPPCRLVYPLYEELAAAYGENVAFIKVDISRVDVALQYNVTSTPSFITYLHGSPQESWAGADAIRIRSTVKSLAMADEARHPHQSLHLPHLTNHADSKPVLFTKAPPLPKLLSKLGHFANDSAVDGMKQFIEARLDEGIERATLPNLPALSEYIARALTDLPRELVFALVDLFRYGLIDWRVSRYYAEEPDHKTIVTLLETVNSDSNCPYALRLVTLQMACNLFSSPLIIEQIVTAAPLRTAVTQLISSSFLDDSHNNTRVAAASLLYNVAYANMLQILDHASKVTIPEEDQIELVASVLEAISQEESSAEALHGMLLALGLFVYRMPREGELVDLMRAMDAQGTVLAKSKVFPNEPLIGEIGQLLGNCFLKR